MVPAHDDPHTGATRARPRDKQTTGVQSHEHGPSRIPADQDEPRHVAHIDSSARHRCEPRGVTTGHDTVHGSVLRCGHQLHDRDAPALEVPKRLARSLPPPPPQGGWSSRARLPTGADGPGRLPRTIGFPRRRGSRCPAQHQKHRRGAPARTQRLVQQTRPVERRGRLASPRQPTPPSPPPSRSPLRGTPSQSSVLPGVPQRWGLRHV